MHRYRNRESGIEADGSSRNQLLNSTLIKRSYLQPRS